MAPRAPLTVRAVLSLLAATLAIFAALLPSAHSRGMSSSFYDAASADAEARGLRMGLQLDTPRTPLHVVFHGTWDSADVDRVREYVSALPPRAFESQTQLGSVAVDLNRYALGATEAIQHQIDIGALPFDRAALYLLVTSADVAVTIDGKSFCADYCSKHAWVPLRSPESDVSQMKVVHVGDVAARCPETCTFRIVEAPRSSGLRHLLRHLHSAIPEALAGLTPEPAFRYPERPASVPPTAAEPAPSSAPSLGVESQQTEQGAAIKTCAAYPSESLVLAAVSYGSNSTSGNSTGVSSGAQAGTLPTCAAVGSLAVPPTVWAK
ncbi:hypothetical protein CLOM_g5132 [Closterium sp. NIES-68]|nr:hypothetical protein CLOM_g5132 [Closterium sp. NIES-68]